MTPSFTPQNVLAWMIICMVTLSICVYIRHYKKCKISRLCHLSHGFFSPLSLYMTPFPILSQFPKSVLNATWSSQSSLNLKCFSQMFYSTYFLTEIWLSTEASASHLCLEVVVMVSLPHIAASRPLPFLSPQKHPTLTQLIPSHFTSTPSPYTCDQ